MMYGSWDIKCKGQSFLSLWAIFYPLTLLTSKFWNKKNSCRHHFTLVYHKWQSYDVWFLRYQARLISRDIRHNFLSFWAIFCPFTPLTQKIKFSKKWKKLLGILSFYTWVPQIKIICMVPEISSTTDIIFCHLGPVFLTKNLDHRLYCSWDIVHDGCNYFSFWATSFPFTSLIAQKMKISEKWKKYLEKSLFYTSAPKLMIIGYTILEIWQVTSVIFVFHFGLLLPFYLSNSPKIKISKKWKKKTWKYQNFTQVCQKSWLYAILSWDMMHDRCNCYFSFWAIFCPSKPLTAPKIKISKKLKNYLEMSSFYTSVPKIMTIRSTVLEIWHVTYVIAVFRFA